MDDIVVAWTDNSFGNEEIYLKRWSGSIWVELANSASQGGVSETSGSSSGPSVALDPLNPVVAWRDKTSGEWEVYVARWDGGAWVQVGAGPASCGAVGIASGASESVSLALDSSGNPMVAWRNQVPGDEIYLRRWDETAWIELGSSGSAGGISSCLRSYDPSLRCGPSERPIVAWQTLPISWTWQIYVRRWDLGTWSELGPGSATGGGLSANSGTSRRPSVAVDAADNLVVAWADETAGTAQIYLKHWNGSTWVQLAGSASGNGLSSASEKCSFPSVAIDIKGNPMVAWSQGDSGSREICVRRWDGVAWAEVGSGSASGGGISCNASDSFTPVLAIDELGRPVVAWRDVNEIYVRRYDPPRYQFSANVDPSGTGTVFPPDGSSLEAETVVSVEAVPESGYAFLNWSGDLAGTENPKDLLMDSDKLVTAHFAPGHNITLATDPAGLRVTADGETRTAPLAFFWAETSTHTTGAPSPQDKGGRRYAWESWSDVGVQEHSITVGLTDDTYTAFFLDIGPAPSSGCGGCSARGDSVPGAGIWVLLVGALLYARHRRPRHVERDPVRSGLARAAHARL